MSASWLGGLMGGAGMWSLVHLGYLDADDS